MSTISSQSTLPSEDDLELYFDSLSNWGRWGEDDQRGTLNYVTPEKRRAAAALITAGTAVPCSRTISSRYAPDNRKPLLRFMYMSGDAAPSAGFGGASDWFGIAFHGHSVTHIDALSHIFWNGKMYNGGSADLVSTAAGSQRNSVEAIGDGILARGVLLDMPRHFGVPWLVPGQAILPEDLDAAEAACGVLTGEGDVLIIRTGRDERKRVEGAFDPATDGTGGLHPACLPWFHERKIAVLVSDVAHEVIPALYPNNEHPIHAFGVTAMGLWLVDNAYLDGLAEACATQNRYDFCFTCAPLILESTTGSPVNPIAHF